MAFLQDTFADVMEWPALSPDLNSIENVWGAVARDLYAGNMQYRSMDELEEAVLSSWNRLSTGFFRTLAESVSDRAVRVLQARGIDF
jgi:hypothetical protein